SVVADLAVGHEVIGADHIAAVDVAARHEFVDLDGAGRLQRDVVELVLGHLDIGVGIDLVAFDNVLVGHFLAAIRIDLGVFDAVAGLAVDLVEGNFFGIRRRRIKGDRAGHQRKAQKAFPVGAGGHENTPKTQQTTVKDTTPRVPFERAGGWNLPTALTDLRPSGSLQLLPAAPGCRAAASRRGAGTSLPTMRFSPDGRATAPAAKTAFLRMRLRWQHDNMAGSSKPRSRRARLS